MIYESLNALSIEILQAIEQFLDIKLPKEYVKFLLEYNGGYPEKTNFISKDNSEKGCIRYFFGVSPRKYHNLLVDFRNLKDRIPNNMLSIACDDFGNRILLSVKGADRGKIYFWDHEMEANDDETPDYSNLSLIADSFEEFINGLYEHEDEAM